MGHHLHTPTSGSSGWSIKHAATDKSSTLIFVPYGTRALVFQFVKEIKQQAFRDLLLPLEESIVVMANSVWTAGTNYETDSKGFTKLVDHSD